MSQLIITVISIGWAIIIIGSFYLFIKGRHIYSLVRGSLVGKVVQVLVYTMMIEMYSVGIVCTAFIYLSPDSKYVVYPIFAVWFITFIITMKVLISSEREARALTGGGKV